jgi:hypothetical protein
MSEVHTYNLFFEEPFEFRPTMAEELLVKAMNSTRPLFLTDDFLARVARARPESIVREMVADLHRDADPDDTAEMLRWYYLFMDFDRDFPRMMMLAEIDASKADQAEEAVPGFNFGPPEVFDAFDSEQDD